MTIYMGEVGPNPRRIEVIPETPPVRRPAPTPAPAPATPAPARELAICGASAMLTRRNLRRVGA